MSNKLIDITGKRFGRLTVVRRAGSYASADGSGLSVTWLCHCDCGKDVIVIGNNLKSGHTKSCGCIRTEKSRENIEVARKAFMLKAEKRRNEKRDA